MSHAKSLSDGLMRPPLWYLQGRCVPGCEENVVGMIFYRYMITTGLLLSISDIASAAFWKWIGQPYDFDAPQVMPTSLH